MTHPFADLLERSAKPSRTVVGLMSGTSADSIDVAVCRMKGYGPEVELLRFSEHAHDLDVKRRVYAAADLDVRGIAELNVRVGEAFAHACLATLKEASIPPWEVDLIGSHGQTVYHHSGVAGTRRATLQVGDGDVIAVKTGRYVISDFRARDIAAGGEGAPLSPVADTILFASREPGKWRRRAVLNLGGIANLTVLDQNSARVFGFDTGPANAPLDRLARILSGGEFACDQDGRYARAGRVNEALLADLFKNDAFLARRPPKSTGFEVYGDAFVAHAAALHGGHDADLLATLTEFVARTIALGLLHCAGIDPPVQEVVVAGGGVKNPALMQRIAAALAPIPIRRSDELGVPSDAREAMAFAVLADMTLRGIAACLPPVTGATAPKLLGKLSFP
ncbi:MAG TPA: anhydro-N-acetylmuramic acid kinase [Isosphaeraceae bacterium]|nr:anhydro-N-acetylmuramic acid kinase [Isosphaeraceae bacterium]